MNNYIPHETTDTDSMGLGNICDWYKMGIGIILNDFTIVPKRDVPYFYITMSVMTGGGTSFNTLRPRQDGRHCPDDIFKCIFLNENV